MKLQQLILRLFLLGQSIGLVVFCCVGQKGLLAVQRLGHEHQNLKKSIEVLKIEIFDLKQNIDQWQTNDFYKEQCAREQLQMARPDEQVYVLD